MTDRELMQQALNLLDDINQCSLPPTGIPLPAEIDHMMETLRARLAQPEPTLALWNFKHNRLAGLSDDRAEVVLIRQREWQGLTDEEIMDACSAVWASHPVEVGQVVAAKLKEKNGF